MSEKSKTSQSVKVDVALIILGIVVYSVFFNINQEQIEAVWDDRMEYLEEKYPPGTYRPPEFSEYLLRPIPPQPARGWMYFGGFLSGIGLLMVFIKIVQNN